MKKIKLWTPTCTLPTYLYIFGKRELKPDHEIQKSIRYINYHFLLLPQPFQFFIFLLNLLCNLILYEMVKFVLD